MHTESHALLPKKTIAGVGAPLAYAVMVVLGFMAFTAWNHGYWWMLKDDHVFGWLAPIFTGYVLYERWPQIVAVSTKVREAAAR